MHSDDWLVRGYSHISWHLILGIGLISFIIWKKKSAGHQGSGKNISWQNVKKKKTNQEKNGSTCNLIEEFNEKLNLWTMILPARGGTLERQKSMSTCLFFFLKFCKQACSFSAWVLIDFIVCPTNTLINFLTFCQATLLFGKHFHNNI